MKKWVRDRVTKVWGVVWRAWGWSRRNRLLALSLTVMVAGLAGGVVVTVVEPEWVGGGESGSTTVRNLGIVVAALVAFPLAVWRAQVADQQARAANRQAETAQEDLRNKRYQESAEMLGSGSLAVRVGAIYALRRLAEDYPQDYHQQVMRLLCAFVRHPTNDPRIVRSGGGRPDVDTAVREIAACHHAQIDTEFACGLYLRGADLRLASLQSVNLSIVTFRKSLRDLIVKRMLGSAEAQLPTQIAKEAVDTAIFQVPPLELFEKAWVILSNANLAGARLERAELRNVVLDGADLSGTALTDADLSDALFSSGEISATGLTQAQLDLARADPANPPHLRGVLDPDTGKQLVWRGRTLDGKPHPNPPPIPDD